MSRLTAAARTVRVWWASPLGGALADTISAALPALLVTAWLVTS